MLSRIREQSIGSQFLLLFGAVGFVLALSAWYCMYLVVGVALEDVPATERETVTSVVRWMVSIVVLVTTCSLGGAVAIVRRSILHSLEQVDRATAAIARGEFGHRIGGSRRDELGRLGASIDRAASRLEVLDRSREELVARVSHELRTPLTIIRCQAFSLSTAIEAPELRTKLALVDDEIDRLTAILDDLLTASTLRARPIQLAWQEVTVAELASSVERRFTDRAHLDGRDVRIDVASEADTVRIDRARIEQVLANLIGNALRHVPPTGVVDVTMESTVRGIRIAVANDGETIPSDELAGLFQPFVQGARSPGSAGLGLSIVRDLLAAHDVEIAVSSTSGRTEFFFELPIVERASTALVQHRSIPTRRRARRSAAAVAAPALGSDA